MFLCCGDALFDLFVAGAEQGDLAQSYVTLAGDAGGSPMNVAVGLARMGHHSCFFTNLSSDLFGQRLRRYLSHNQVDFGLSPETNRNTTLAIVETRDDGSANYVFYSENTADVSITESRLPDKLSDAIRVVHFSSYSTAVEPTSGSLIRLASREKQHRLISYDLNLRPSIQPDIDKWREAFAGFAASATLIKASDEDIETLSGKGREDQFIADSFAHGAELVFITRGPDGASGFKPDGSSVHCDGVSVSVVDTVGAGDTFQAATLHWLEKEGHLAGGSSLTGNVDLKASMEFAIRAAAITCTRSGADLPYLADL